MRAIPLALLIVGIPACAPTDTLETISRQPPSIRGTVTAVERARTSAQRSSLRIEERPDQSSGDNKALVSLVESTLLYERTPDDHVRISIDSIQTGWLAEAWFDGPVAESYPVQASASLVIVERTAGPATAALFRTDSVAYTLRARNNGHEARIGVTFTNRTSDTTYFVNCNGAVGVSLEKLVEGNWRNAWSPVMPACLSPPIAVAPGATRSMPIEVFGGFPGSNAYPQFVVAEIPGIYRAVWNSAVTDYQSELPFGAPLPLAQRISNRFTLQAP
jgi:hypothetical protein